MTIMEAGSSVPDVHKPALDDDFGQYLTFSCNGEAYGVDVYKTREIIEYHDVTPVPMMPDFIRGVINLRGSVVAVVDLAARLNGPLSAPGKKTCIVVVEAMSNDEQVEIGLMVDLVLAVIEVPRDDIEPPPRFGTRIQSAFIAGMAKSNDDFLVLLDVDSIVDLGGIENLQSGTGNSGEKGGRD